MEALTPQQETYNKLYTRILCLIVEQFHFELQDMEDFTDVVDLRMELVAQDALSAKALKQLNFLRKENERKAAARTQGESKESKESGESKENGEKGMEVEPSAEASTQRGNAAQTEAEKEVNAKEGVEGTDKEVDNKDDVDEDANEDANEDADSDANEDANADSDEDLRDPSAQDEAIRAELKAARSAAEQAEQQSQPSQPSSASSSSASALSPQDRRRILRLVLTVVIPDLRRLMVSTDEQRNQTVRCGVAVVIVQLLRHLPAKVMEMCGLAAASTVATSPAWCRSSCCCCASGCRARATRRATRVGVSSIAEA